MNEARPGIHSTERDREAYTLARQFLLGLDGVNHEILETYLTPDARLQNSLSALYERLIESAQNSGMMPSVIGGSIGGLKNLGPVLCEFDPLKVVARGWNANELLEEIIRVLQPRGAMRKGSRSLWPRFCRAAISGARFLARFTSADDFNEWVRFFDADDRARPALPVLLSLEIDGIGFSLACDFLKEIGYVNFAKPDVHLKDIFFALKLSESRADYEVFKSVVRIANSAGVTPYAVDKVFWLIGSGNFYRTEGLRTGNRKADFIALANAAIGI